mmetsp:Transcript_52818/g.153670  ORF Transcript_52818/g.153670 Transcript_52818/m.153670 type:complete len:221 (+) Transcript_52818:477-1139(+)
MNSRAMAFSSTSVKVSVAVSQRHPSHSRMPSRTRRGRNMKKSNMALRPAGNPCRVASLLSPCTSMPFSEPMVGVCRSRRPVSDMIFRMSFTTVKDQMARMQPKNKGWDRGIWQIRFFSSRVKFSKRSGLKCPTMPRWYPFTVSVVWPSYIITSNLSYASRASCTACAVTSLLNFHTRKACMTIVRTSSTVVMEILPMRTTGDLPCEMETESRNRAAIPAP